MSELSVNYLNQEAAQNVDVDLMGPSYGFSIDQLMELAGLSVACVVADAFPLPSDEAKLRVLVICGPGNNGGDGLVAARHLRHFGYDVQIHYPKRTDKPLYKNLVLQCSNMGASFLPDSEAPQLDSDNYDVIVDGIFGFSFKGSVRAPFDTILDQLSKTKIPIVSIDIPSGWDVEQGPRTDGTPCLNPEVLVSLTAPKLCAKHFRGKHYLGGRFVPPALSEKYALRLPRYPSVAQFIRLS